jgi:hypothetical protein
VELVADVGQAESHQKTIEGVQCPTAKAQWKRCMAIAAAAFFYGGAGTAVLDLSGAPAPEVMSDPGAACDAKAVWVVAVSAASPAISCLRVSPPFSYERTRFDTIPSI